jgi:hypothetical protein
VPEYIQVWRATVADDDVERLLAVRPAALAEAQRANHEHSALLGPKGRSLIARIPPATLPGIAGGVRGHGSRKLRTVSRASL